MVETPVLLLVGGDEADEARLVGAVRASGRALRVVRVPDAAAPRPSPRSLAAAVVTTDAGFPDIHAARAALGDVPVMLFTGAEDEAAAERWIRDGADDWLCRPTCAGVGAVLARVEREREAARGRADAERRWQAETAELLRLARSPSFRGSDLDAAFREINEAAVRGIGVSRCGVWLFDDARTTIAQRDMYDAAAGAHTAGASLSIEEFRGYFDALHSQRLLPVADVHADARTLELVPAYFGPEGIGATIDVAVRLRGELVGALCIEHRGVRQWTADETSFAGALSDLVSLALEGSQRHRAEAALAESEQRARDLFTHSSDAVVLLRLDAQGHARCEDVNPAAERLLGVVRGAAPGREAGELFGASAAEALERQWRMAVSTRARMLSEAELQLPSGARWLNTALIPFVDADGVVRRVAVIARDVTQGREAEALQRRLEAQLQEAQKSEALARLAAHIAHDVNNLLSVIAVHAQRLEGQGGRTDEVAEAVLSAVSRGRELTQQVLTFGRQRPPERQPVDLGTLAQQTLRLLQPTAAGARLVARVAPGCPPALGDPGQLHQVLTNLCTNAVQALGGRGGEVEVRVDVIEVDVLVTRQEPRLPPGRWVRVQVRDTGVGMDAETARRSFEPFFSTRGSGNGTGLGLAVVHTIVQAHEGLVLVDSEPGKGSTFSVYLPPAPAPQSAARRGQHLMLVDDHPGMARVSARLLETFGYKTSVFDDPREALEAFVAAPGRYDAVLTDLSMPQMSGEELTRQLRAVRPTLPVIASSGMATELDEAARARLGFDAVLVKPWRLEEAIAVLERLLPAS